VNPHGLIVLTRISVTGTNTDLSSAPTTATIAPLWDNITVSGSPASAVYYKLEPTAAGNRLVIEWSHVSFVGGPQTGQVTFEAILGSDGTIVFNYLNLDPNLMRPGDPGATIGIKNSNTAGADPLVIASPTLSNSLIASGSSVEIARNIIPAVSDYYAFTLSSGQTTTVAVTGLNSAVVHVTLVDSSGNTLAAGSPPGSGSPIAEAINNVSAPPGTYYALVTGAPGAAYSLTVTRDAALAAGNNASFSTAEDITATKVALGAITATTTENWYSINLAAGTLLRLQTHTPGGSTSQFVNNLDPAIELYSPSDVLVASGQGSRNQLLVTTVAAAGSYRIRVRSADTTTGEYFLSVTTGVLCILGKPRTRRQSARICHCRRCKSTRPAAVEQRDDDLCRLHGRCDGQYGGGRPDAGWLARPAGSALTGRRRVKLQFGDPHGDMGVFYAAYQRQVSAQYSLVRRD
jgi:hypothetical protein